jgi:hypothetical protein
MSRFLGLKLKFLYHQAEVPVAEFCVGFNETSCFITPEISAAAD